MKYQRARFVRSLFHKEHGRYNREPINPQCLWLYMLLLLEPVPDWPLLGCCSIFFFQGHNYYNCNVLQDNNRKEAYPHDKNGKNKQRRKLKRPLAVLDNSYFFSFCFAPIQVLLPVVGLLSENPGLLRQVMCWHLSHCMLVSCSPMPPLFSPPPHPSCRVALCRFTVGCPRSCRGRLLQVGSR